MVLALSVSGALGFEVDAIGLSPLEHSAVQDRARAELLRDVDVVAISGLVACGVSDPPCAQRALSASGMAGGAAVRVVKVLNVVRVQCSVFGKDGALVAQSSRTLDVAAVRDGALFDAAVHAAVAQLSARELPGALTSSAPLGVAAPAAAVAQPTPTTPSTEATRASGGPPVAAVVTAAVGAGALALCGAFVVVQAVVANDATSSGADKQNARVLGPAALVAGGVVALATTGVMLAFAMD